MHLQLFTANHLCLDSSSTCDSCSILQKHAEDCCLNKRKRYQSYPVKSNGLIRYSVLVCTKVKCKHLSSARSSNHFLNEKASNNHWLLLHHRRGDHLLESQGSYFLVCKNMKVYRRLLPFVLINVAQVLVLVTPSCWKNPPLHQNALMTLEQFL